MPAALLFCFSQASNYDEPRLISVAREAIASEVQGVPKGAVEKGKSPAMPVFVTIEIDGVIRGCRGSLTIRSTTLEDEIALSARAAAAHDPRYKPLTAKDLDKFKVTVTVVEDKQPISDAGALRPEDGLALESGGRWGIVLPWEGKDPQIRLKWAYQKAGVPIGSSATLYKLSATRFRG